MGLKRVVTFIILFLINASLQATTFLQTPIKERMRDASGIIKGQFLGENYKKLPDNTVVTEATFQVLEVSGLGSRDIINQNSFKVLYQGGRWHGMVHKVHGSPKFKKGEECYLLIKKAGFGFILPNLAMSKFTETKEDGQIVLKSEIFPEKQGVGKITLAEFKELSGQYFETPLKKVRMDKFVYIPKETKNSVNESGRSPASKKKEENRISVIWFILGLGVLGFIPAFLMRGKGDA